MASTALKRWQSDAQSALDEVEHAHVAVGGLGPGRRRLTREINHAYVTLLAARFQSFSRDLHSEVSQVLSAGVADQGLAIVLEGALTSRRRLDHGNANPSNLQEDFSRFGFDFLAAVKARDQRNDARLAKLEDLNGWRNAIAHHDIEAKLTEGKLEPSRIQLRTCRSWRSALKELAITFDEVLADQCENLGRLRLW